MRDLHSCELCPRLTTFRQQQKQLYPGYHCLPVTAFGDQNAQLLIVGLAPGLHGANATGRPFTGDASGNSLFQTLFKFGFANKCDAQVKDDEMQLFNCRITNAVKCVPPQNKPAASEIIHCNDYLRDEMNQMPPGSVILALGSIAHNSILKSFALTLSHYPFGHLSEHSLPAGLQLIDSYHCSRYNMNTGRLNLPMFENVFVRIRQILS